jgi:hypothetical protein
MSALTSTIAFFVSEVLVIAELFSFFAAFLWQERKAVEMQKSKKMILFSDGIELK